MKRFAETATVFGLVAGLMMATPANAQLSGMSVIAAARASAAAAIASNSPGAGRPRGRETREGRDGPIRFRGRLEEETDLSITLDAAADP